MKITIRNEILMVSSLVVVFAFVITLLGFYVGQQFQKKEMLEKLHSIGEKVRITGESPYVQYVTNSSTAAAAYVGPSTEWLEGHKAGWNDALDNFDWKISDEFPKDNQ